MRPVGAFRLGGTATPRGDGLFHVDSPLLVSRLQALGATTYAFLLCHSPSDWGELEEYLALAEPAARHPSVTAVAMDDFNSNVSLFTGDYVCSMMEEAPALTFYAVDYHPSVLGDVDTPDQRREGVAAASAA